jgi:prepilin-type N-terminal cleavage/methylation domain-containing protein
MTHHDRRRREHGFTMIELLIVVVIVAILAAIATSAYAHQRDATKGAACRADMAVIQKAEMSYIAVNGAASPGMQALSEQRYLDRVPACPGGGTYTWAADVDGDVVLVCSVHGKVDGEAATAVASTFKTKTDSLVKLVLDYHAKNGGWPRSWAPYCYTDLGLDPADYAGALEGVFYKVGGSKVAVRPAAGYVMTVTDVTGKARVMTNNLNWDIVYDATSGKWFFHTISPANEVDISTMSITQA